MEWVLQHGADAAQGLVVIGVVVAVAVAWRVMSNAISWVADDASQALGMAVHAHAEIDALKTRVRSLEDAAARSKKRDADKAQVRIAKVA
jgi:hypothetical protein